jgi:hypothetical protein
VQDRQLPADSLDGDRGVRFRAPGPADRGLTMARRAHGEGSMYRTPDGYWHASINSGDRTRRQARTQGEVRQKLDELKKARQADDDLAAPREPLVAEWVKTWIELVERTCKPPTARTYRTHGAYPTPIRRVPLVKLTPRTSRASMWVSFGVEPAR